RITFSGWPLAARGDPVAATPAPGQDAAGSATAWPGQKSGSRQRGDCGLLSRPSARPVLGYSDRVGKMAAQSNIKIVQAKYSPQDVEASGLRPVLIEAGLSGDYVHIVKFINSLERDKTLFIVNSVALGDAQGGTVKLQLKMETYLKS